MIQRIQTLFLVLVACSFGALFRLPFAASNIAAANFMADKVFSVQDHLALSGITIFASGVSILTIFLYKNRKLQRKLVYFIILLAIGLGVSSYILLKMDGGDAIKTAGIHAQAGIFLPVLSIILCLLAGYYIGKDEKLVKSMDRLR